MEEGGRLRAGEDRPECTVPGRPGQVSLVYPAQTRNGVNFLSFLFHPSGPSHAITPAYLSNNLRPRSTPPPTQRAR